MCQGGTGAFQVSWAEYQGKRPLSKLSEEGLRQFAVDFGGKNFSGELVESSSGSCGFGSFGTAIYRTETRPHIQTWIITDGADHILATYICDQRPEPDELSEAQHIATSLALGPE